MRTLDPRHALLGVLVFSLIGCQDWQGSEGDAWAGHPLMAPFTPRVELRISTLGEEPLDFAGARSRNDTLFFLERPTRDLWILDLNQPPHLLTRGMRGSAYDLPPATSFLFWEGRLGFLDRRGTFWNLDAPVPEASFPFGEGEGTAGLLEHAVVVEDSLLLAVVKRLSPPTASLLPRMGTELVSVAGSGGTPTVLATLAEGLMSGARVFSMAAGADSLWVVDPIEKKALMPRSDPAGLWHPLPGLIHRPPTAELEEALAGMRRQMLNLAGQLGSDAGKVFALDHQISMVRGFWHGRTLWAVAEASPGFALDGYCRGVYQGTLVPRASAIHAAPPYLVTVTLAEDLEQENALRIYPFADLPELCPVGPEET